jgi:hypothetical protein
MLFRTVAVGSADGMIHGDEGVESVPWPTEFVAATVNVYTAPDVRPLTVAVRPLYVIVAAAAVGDTVTAYDVIAAPPLEVGAVHASDTDAALTAVTRTFVGASGTVASGVTLFTDTCPALPPFINVVEPMAFVTRMLNAYDWPGVSPVTVIGNDGLVATTVVPFSIAYSVMELPPSLITVAAAVEIVALPLPAVATNALATYVSKAPELNIDM